MLKSLLLNSLRPAAAFLILATASVMAEEVKVEGVHLCCGKCVKGATKALTGVSGVSQVRVNKSEETVSFEAADKAAVQRGLTSLAEAGFYGAPSTAGPDFKIDPNLSENEVRITHMHLCCGGCIKAASASLRGVKGVNSIKTQAKQGTMTLSGEKINLAETLKALHAAGFHGTVK